MVFIGPLLATEQHEWCPSYNLALFSGAQRNYGLEMIATL